jgi:hypothetical protein
MTLVTSKVTWLQWLLENFGVSVSMSIPLLSDSTWAISIARDPIKHEITKHIDVDAYFMSFAMVYTINVSRSFV